MEHTFFTPSCGCGSLDEKGALKALALTKELLLRLKEKCGVKI